MLQRGAASARGQLTARVLVPPCQRHCPSPSLRASFPPSGCCQRIPNHQAHVRVRPRRPLGRVRLVLRGPVRHGKRRLVRASLYHESLPAPPPPACECGFARCRTIRECPRRGSLTAPSVCAAPERSTSPFTGERSWVQTFPGNGFSYADADLRTKCAALYLLYSGRVARGGTGHWEPSA